MESQKSMGGKRIKSSLQIGKRELENLYFKKKLSTIRIAEQFQVSVSVIQRLFRESGIQVRSRSEAAYWGRTNHVTMTGELRSILVGELLGDGSLQSSSPLSALFAGTSKYKKYLIWLFGLFQDLGMKRSEKISEGYFPKPSFHLRSLSYAELKEIYDLFYPDGKKIFPFSLIFNPLICRHWFLGDGSLVFATIKGNETCRRKNKIPSIRLATDCFSEEEIDFAVEQFRDLGFLAKKVKHEKAYIIRLYVISTQKFLNYIGPCPKEIESIYDYKWNWKREDPNQLKLDI